MYALMAAALSALAVFAGTPLLMLEFDTATLYTADPNTGNGGGAGRSACAGARFENKTIAATQPGGTILRTLRIFEFSKWKLFG
jgi:hypothetical protein